MAGDLEDFLKRAAARRQNKPPQQQPAAGGATRQASQYSDRSRERVVRQLDDDEPILVAEILDEPDAMAKRRKAILAAKQEAARLQAEAATQLAKLRQDSGESSTPGLTFTGEPRADLIRLLRQPGGIKQAILLREILDRPIDRW